MLDPFLPVYYTSHGQAYHADPSCQSFLKNRHHDTTKPRRSRLAAMLATKRPACKWCAQSLALTPMQANELLAVAA